MKAYNIHILNLFARLVALLAFTQFAYATTYNINYTGSGDYQGTIQSTINSASDGDTIVFGNGRFEVGSQISTTKTLTVRGAGPGTTSLVLTGSSTTLWYCN